MGVAVRTLRARLDRELQAAGLRLGQYQLLRLLWESDGLTPRELADRLVVEMPTVTRTVQRLIRDGFARREAHPMDARSVRIYLTEKGRRLQERVDAIFAEQTERAMSGFSQAERAALVDFMNRMAANCRHEGPSPNAASGVE
jgi:DNA-binding MarR family transcriptional regulator